MAAIRYFHGKKPNPTRTSLRLIYASALVALVVLTAVALAIELG